MPIVSTKEILGRAFQERYGVGAFNMVNDLTLERLKGQAQDVLVIEDSRNGLLAAAGAGLRCLITVNGYTEREDFSEAVLVVSSLGDPGGEQTRLLASRCAARPSEFITLDDLSACLA